MVNEFLTSLSFFCNLNINDLYISPLKTTFLFQNLSPTVRSLFLLLPHMTYVVFFLSTFSGLELSNLYDILAPPSLIGTRTFHSSSSFALKFWVSINIGLGGCVPVFLVINQSTCKNKSMPSSYTNFLPSHEE
jgi:hypothetical protein